MWSDNAVIIPFSLAFQSLWRDMRFFWTIAVFNYLGDLIFCLDMTLYFWTPYTRDGMYERNLPEVRAASDRKKRTNMQAASDGGGSNDELGR
jgi:hypothetical protein